MGIPYIKKLYQLPTLYISLLFSLLKLPSKSLPLVSCWVPGWYNLLESSWKYGLNRYYLYAYSVTKPHNLAFAPTIHILKLFSFSLGTIIDPYIHKSYDHSSVPILLCIFFCILHCWPLHCSSKSTSLACVIPPLFSPYISLGGSSYY